MDAKLNRRTASIWLLLALTAASIEPIVVKLGYQTGVTPLQFLVLRNIFAAIVILILTRISGWRWRWIGLQQLRLVASVSVLLLATNGLVLYALKHVSAVIVVTAMTTTPAFVAIVNQIRGRDLLGWRFWGGFLACFFGVLLTINIFDAQTSTIHGLGIAALALAVTCSTTYRTRMEVVTAAIEPREVSIYIFAINAALVSIVIWPWLDAIPVAAVPTSAWLGAAAALANLAFLSAIKLVGSTRMSIFDMLQRPLVIIAAAFILDEPFTLLQGLGIVLVLFGVQAAKVKRRLLPSTPAAIAGEVLTTQQRAY